MTNILSVDLEEWYHICGVDRYIPRSSWGSLQSRASQNVYFLLELLSQYNIRATFFVLGFVAERYKSLIKEIDKAGHEIATHGYEHRRIFEMTQEEFRNDLGRSIDILSSIIDKKIIGFRAPEWSIRPDTIWALEVLIQNGIKYDSSVFPFRGLSGKGMGRYPFQHQTTSGAIWEFPLTTISILGEPIPLTGGFPLRLAPLFAITQAISSLNQAQESAMIYIHPWELDNDPPRIKLPLGKRIVHYYNLQSTYKKLTSLFKQFSFGPFQEVYCQRLECPND